MSAPSKCIAIRVLIYRRATTSLPPVMNTNGTRTDHLPKHLSSIFQFWCAISAVNTRYALILAVTIGLFLIGCTTTRDERRMERLMRHRSWPWIQQIAEKEVKKREI